MKIISKLLSCLLVVFILFGCTEEPPFDPETATDYADIYFQLNHLSVTNAEGKEIHYKGDTIEEKVLNMELEGEMEHYNERSTGLDLGTWFITPFSECFTVQTRIPITGKAKSAASFGVDFYKDGKSTSNCGVSGFEGVATIHSDGVIELWGNNEEIRASFSPRENLDFNSMSLEGSGEDYVRLQLVDGEIVAEGLVGEYTVKKYDEDNGEISRETFQAEKSTP